MSLTPLDFTELRAGEYTPFDLFDAKGRLLAQKGLLIREEGLAVHLTRLGLYVRERDAQSWHRSLMHKVDVMANAGATVSELAQLEPERQTKPEPPKDAATQVREWHRRWESLVAADSTQLLAAARGPYLQGLPAWQSTAEQAARLFDASPDLAHYRLVRFICEGVAAQLPAEVLSAQGLLWWLCARQVGQRLGWGAKSLSWLAEAVHAGRWASLQKRKPSPDDAPTPGAGAVLYAWLGATAPLDEHTLALADTPQETVTLADRVGVWLGAAQALQGRRPSCGAGVQSWVALAQMHLSSPTAGPRATRPGGTADAAAAPAAHAITAWQRLMRAAELILQRDWGPYPVGSFVGLANGDVGIVMRPGPSPNAPLVLRLRGRSGMPYIDLPFRNATSDGHAIREAIAQADIGIRLPHERLLERAFAV
jgi:hypothetical protein